MKIPKVIPITDLRQDAAAVLKKLQDAGGPLVITQRGRATAVLLSIQGYEQSQNEKEILRLLAQGEKDIAQGRGYSLESVLREADAFLEDAES